MFLYVICITVDLEALHHLNIREKLKFDYFAIGRDHAGAENVYKNDDAVKLVKNLKKFKINIFYHKGAFYCAKCKNYYQR